MKASFVTGIVAALAAFTAHDVYAVRYAQEPLLWHRTAVSSYLGKGYPIGVFASDELPGDGNHEAYPFDWTIEIEHFAGRTWSLGFSAAYTSYTDKTYSDLHTDLSTYSGFIRIVVPSGTAIRPYFRAGMGGQQVEFHKDNEYRFDADYAFSFQAGAGLLWLPRRWLGLNVQALYYYGATEDSYLEPEAMEYFGLTTQPVVGFDTTYFVVAGGISLFF